MLIAQDMSESVDGVHITEKANEVVAEAVWAAMEDELPRFSKPSRKFLEDSYEES